MWIVYAVVALAAAALLAVIGLWPVAVIALVAVPILGLAGLRKAGTRRVEGGAGTGPAQSVPDSREASYDARVDPNRAPTGSSTGS